MGESMLTLGVANHGPEQLLRHLHEVYKVDVSEILQVPVAGNLSLSNKLSKYILFYTSRDLLRHVRYLSKSKFKDKVIFVLGSSQVLYTVEGLVPLDYIDIDSNRFYDFDLLDYFLPIPLEHSKIKKREQDYIDKLSSKVQNGSILTQLMTSIYTIPKSINQKSITYGICRWFVKGGADRELSEFFNSNAKQHSLSANVRGRLEEILFSPIAKNFKKAFNKLQQRRKKGLPVENEDINDIAKQFDVPDFEIRYITIKYDNESLIKDGDKRSIDSLVDGGEK